MRGKRTVRRPNSSTASEQESKTLLFRRIFGASGERRSRCGNCGSDRIYFWSGWILFEKYILAKSDSRRSARRPTPRCTALGSSGLVELAQYKKSGSAAGSWLQRLHHKILRGGAQATKRGREEVVGKQKTASAANLKVRFGDSMKIH